MVNIATLRRKISNQRGSSLIEILVAAAIFGAIGVVFVNAVSSSQMGAHQIEAMSTAESIARNQIELIKSLPYNDGNYYPLVTADQDRYAANIEVLDLSPVEYPNTIQKIVVTISENDNSLLSLETLKVKR
ncbi:prepilin-type N-terminal cleavage/methylation domain-containing protein [Chloroflexota bacterium]